MKIEGYRIWAILFVAIFALSGYMYFNVLENRDQLQEQSFRSLDLTRDNLLSSWENLTVRTDSIYNFEESTDSDIRNLIQTLLDQMPPSDFFDLTFFTDRNGKVLISSPEIPVVFIPPNILMRPKNWGRFKRRSPYQQRSTRHFGYRSLLNKTGLTSHPPERSISTCSEPSARKSLAVPAVRSVLQVSTFSLPCSCCS